MGVGPAKFFNARKMKFGLNMQAVCDASKKFLDVTCSHPGCASDFTMWLDCDLRKKVETPGFLRPGLVIYGDNAYVNTMSTGPRDAFNFYQSQLRITIDGAFGMLVHKWGCLRKTLPSIRVSKQTRLFITLCKLHNYCIDQRSVINDNICVDDRLHVMLEGGFAMDDNSRRVYQLLDAGPPELNDREYRLQSQQLDKKKDLPIYKMLKHIEEQGHERPVPLTNNNRNSLELITFTSTHSIPVPLHQSVCQWIECLHLRHQCSLAHLLLECSMP